MIIDFFSFKPRAIESIKCGLCNQRIELSRLNCNHIICDACMEIQLMYSKNIPCFQCKGVQWKDPYSSPPTRL
jgi:hypothetical protein